METNNKYYTPSIEEFHPGFEFKKSSDLPINHWEDSICSTYHDLLLMQRNINNGYIRVKYLDKEDIESFEFELSAEYGDYIEFNDNLKSVNPKSNKILFNTKTKEINIESFILSDQSSYPLFNGMCLNKSELKVLLKQLQICQ